MYLRIMHRCDGIGNVQLFQKLGEKSMKSISCQIGNHCQMWISLALGPRQLELIFCIHYSPDFARHMRRKYLPIWDIQRGQESRSEQRLPGHSNPKYEAIIRRLDLVNSHNRLER